MAYFLLSVEYVPSYLRRQMKGPQPVEKREGIKHKAKGRYFAAWALLSPGVLCSSCLCRLPPSPWAPLCPSPGQRQKHKTWGHLLPPVASPPMCTPLALSLPDACGSYFRVIHNSVHMIHPAISAASFSFFPDGLRKCIALVNRQHGVIKCT